MDADRGLDPAEVQRRLTHEQLGVACQQMLLSPYAVLVVDAYLSWLVWRGGAPGVALALLGLSCVCQAWRRWQAKQLQADPDLALQPALRRLRRTYFVLGCARAAIIPAVFVFPFDGSPHLLTMVMVGAGAGGVSTSAGMLALYRAWCFPVATTLAGAWALRFDAEGIGLAVLILLMFAMLVAFVRRQGDTLRHAVGLSLQLERSLDVAAIERDRANAANHAKTRFFAAASHDLRQPLHALSINATTLDLLAQRSNNPKLQEVNQGIGRALAQCSRLLDGLLDISKLDSGAVKPVLVPTELRHLLQLIQAEHAPVAAFKGLRLHVLPGPACMALTDPTQLTRVVGNLVDNALKFTERGEVALDVRPAHDGAGRSCLRLSVSDTGIGIASDEQQRVFEDFYQVGNASRDRAQGLGLGLSIVARTAELLGITLRLLSEPGRGSRFELDLPEVKDPAAAATADQADDEASVAAEETTMPRLSALVIDDEEEALLAMRPWLEALGWDVRCAVDLGAAERHLDEGFRPQVAAVDFRLKNINGLQVIEALRRRQPDLPAVIITGDTAPTQLKNILSAGIPILHKPIDGRRLAHALVQAARKGGMHEARSGLAVEGD